MYFFIWFVKVCKVFFDNCFIDFILFNCFRVCIYKILWVKVIFGGRFFFIVYWVVKVIVIILRFFWFLSGFFISISLIFFCEIVYIYCINFFLFFFLIVEKKLFINVILCVLGLFCWCFKIYKFGFIILLGIFFSILFFFKIIFIFNFLLKIM